MGPLITDGSASAAKILEPGGAETSATNPPGADLDRSAAINGTRIAQGRVELAVVDLALDDRRKWHHAGPRSRANRRHAERSAIRSGGPGQAPRRVVEDEEVPIAHEPDRLGAAQAGHDRCAGELVRDGRGNQPPLVDDEGLAIDPAARDRATEADERRIGECRCGWAARHGGRAEGCRVRQIQQVHGLADGLVDHDALAAANKDHADDPNAPERQ